MFDAFLSMRFVLNVSLYNLYVKLFMFIMLTLKSMILVGKLKKSNLIIIRYEYDVSARVSLLAFRGPVLVPG